MNASAGHSSQCSHQLGVAAVADDEARLLLLRAVCLHVGVPKLLCNDVSSALLQWAGMLLGSLNMLLLLLLLLPGLADDAQDGAAHDAQLGQEEGRL